MGGEYGGGVSTRESMKGEYTAPVHHCHTLTFRDQRGREESKLRRKWQLKGVPLGAGPGRGGGTSSFTKLD